MLTEVRIRNAKPKDRGYKLYDERGLYLYITPKGTKSWRYDYIYRGKRKTLTIGRYPAISLREARQRRDEAERLLAHGKDPSSKEEETLLFRDIAKRWFESNLPGWKESHSRTIMYRMKVYILPELGDRKISEIRKGDVLQILERIKQMGKLETARRVYQIINGIFSYAHDMELTERIPSHGLSKHVQRGVVRHLPAILDPVEVGRLMIRIENYPGEFIVKSALKFLALTFVRPGELRYAKWEEVSLDEAIWDIPAERMKTNRPHRVFLARQAVEILERVRSLKLPSQYIFPGRNPDRPMSENTLNKALRKMGYNTRTEITAHGFRATARTLIHERLGYSPEVIEHQLGHRVPDVLGEAYNRTRFYEQRKKMMQDWADYLDILKKQAIKEE